MAQGEASGHLGLKEHVGEWFWLGLATFIVGTPPEDWFRQAAELLPERLTQLVSIHDLRLMFLAAGAAIMLYDVVNHARRRRGTERAANAEAAAPVPARASVNVQAPVSVNAPVSVHAPVDVRPQILFQLDPAALARPLAHETAPAGKPVVLPFASIGEDFKGREEFLLDLHARLRRRDRGHAAITSAIRGMGGIGKTCAAVEYAWAHYDDYAALLFATAETPAALRTNLAALAGPLRLPEQAATEDAVSYQAVLNWLNDNPGWLLILDNVDTQEALNAAEALIGRTGRGDILLTSRLTGFAAGIETMELGLLALDDAIAFLLDRTTGKRRPNAEDAEVARMLAGEELDRLPLALEHAAAFITRRGCSLADYRKLLRESPDTVLNAAGVRLTHYDRTIARTWHVSIARVSDQARALLERLSFLAPDPVPLSLLDVAVPGVEPADLHEAAADLASYSLLRREAAPPGIAVHRVVQEVTRRNLDAAASRQRLTEALGWVDEAFAGDPGDVRSWPVLEPLSPHALAVAERGDASGIADPTAWLMNQLGLLFWTKALHRRAEPLMRRALAIDEASFGPEHPNVAIRLNNLAQLLQDTNRLGEAEPLMRRALAIDEASFGPEHPNVAVRLNNLATLLQDTNRLGEAEPLMRRALAIDETSFGPEHPNVAIRLGNLALLLKATNRLGEAEPLMRRTLAIDEASFGPLHPEVAIDLNNLGRLLQDTNRLGEAEPLMRRALAIDEASFGPEHPHVATDLNNLAQLLKATNRLGEAEPLMRRALAIDEASLGPEHPDVARDLNNLGRLLQDTNRLGEAEPLMRRALAIDEASFGPEHPNVAIGLSNLARLVQDTNRLGEAEPLMRRAAVIFLRFERQTGHTHPHRDAVVGNYAALLRQAGKSEAEIRSAIESLTDSAG